MAGTSAHPRSIQAVLSDALLFPHLIFTNRNHTFADIHPGVAKGFDAGADIVSSFYLNQRTAGSLRSTSSRLKSFIHLVITRGLLVNTSQIILLITFFVTSSHLYWLAVHINTKLHVNSFFQLLNARTSLQDKYAMENMILSADTVAHSTPPEYGLAVKL
ncbi:hypothetical protein B0H11DRAFT_2250556 [Mycena galericulata]|nr:hypothetical protein B0H11DRAFT_2250556 [Mycena galericulata]